jgi:hypothetical protein
MGGGGGPAMKLENPLKLKRIAVVRPPRPQQDFQPRSREGGGRSGPPGRSSPAGAASRRPAGGSDGPGDATRPAADSDSRPRRVPGGKDKPPVKDYKKPSDVNNRKTSLRLGTGKKGRSATINQRRGSLRRRDRSGQKAAKEEAAIERKTVYLPE